MTKVADLEGPDLDAAVARALGKRARVIGPSCFIASDDMAGYSESFWPSVNWLQAGPIIERERISVIDRGGCWCADLRGGPVVFGPTPLIAAMRAFVAAKLGKEISPAATA